MKKIVLFAALIFICGSVFSQIYTPVTPTTYGNHANREQVDSTFLYPTGCGSPSLRSYDKKMSALFYDSCAGKMYIYNPALATWDEAGGGDGKVVDLFGFFGDSNLQGWGLAATSKKLPPNIMYQFYNNVVTNKTTDPIGNANTGSQWPAFAETWYMLTRRKICFVPMGIPGSSMTISADVGNGNWDTTGVLFDTAVARTFRAIDALEAQGYTVHFRGIITNIGGNDALGINLATTTQAEFIAAFAKFRKRIRIAFGTNTPIYINMLGKQVTGSDVGHSLIRSADVLAENADSLTRIITWNEQYFITRGLQTDQYHYTQPGYNENGRIGAEQVLNSGGNKFQEQGANVYFTRKVGIGLNSGLPGWPLTVNDSVYAGGIIFGRRGFANAPSVTSEGTYLTIQSGQDLIIFQPIGANPIELRGAQNAQGTSGQAPNPYTIVYNGFNFGAGGTPDIRRHMLFTTSGTNVGSSQKSGNIIFRPGTGYVVSHNTLQYVPDSVLVQLMSGAIFGVYGKLYSTDSVQFTNIPAGGTTTDSIAVITSTGIVKRMDPARISGGGGGGGATPQLDNLSAVAINAALVLGTSDAFALGSAAKQWSDLFLAEGGVINWDNGDATLTQSGNNLNLAGADLNVAGNINVTPTADNQNTVQINNSAGNPAWLLGTYPGVPTYSGMWAQTGSPTGSNPILITNGSQVIFNAPSDMSFRINNASSTPAISVNSGQQIGFSNSGPAVGTLVAFGEPGSIAGNWSASGIGSGTIKFNLQSAAGTYNWNWPTTAGTVDQAVMSGGGGSNPIVYLPLKAGTSTPTISNLVNVTGTPSSIKEQYMRVGSVVTVSGSLSVNATTLATLTTIDLTIPVASTFSVAGSAAGNFTSAGGVSSIGNILGLSTTVQFSFTPPTSGNRTIYYHYTYNVE